MNPTIEVTWVEDAEHWRVQVTGAAERVMAARRDARGDWWPAPDPARRPAAGSGSWDVSAEAFAELAAAVAQGRATGEQAVTYGRYLFDALLGKDAWASLGRPEGPLVVGLRLPRGALHGLVWELMHDGTGYLALRRPGPLVLPRIVGPQREPPATLDRPPRLLFAVGSRLEDADVRAGAEVMALLRDVAGSSRGAVTTRVITDASLASLEAGSAAVAPDVVHLIGHGRWDARAGVGRLTLRREGGREGQEHTAAELAPALGSPALVVLSACDGALATAGAPLAAELAEAGVPIVVAMAGAVGDTACRIFTRSLVAAVACGRPLVAALADGRTAAFAHTAYQADRVDWALPAVFVGGGLDPDLRLVDPTALTETQDVIERHGHVDHPVFAGRHELFADLAAVLGPGGPAALVLYSRSAGKLGGTRALKELAAAAVRLGHLPVRVNGFPMGAAPSTLEAVALEIVKAMWNVAVVEQVPTPGHTVGVLGGTPDEVWALDPAALPTVPGQRLAAHLRADLVELRDHVHTRLPRVFRPDAAPLLLLDDVDLYDRGLEPLLGLLGPLGLGMGPGPLPVVLYGREDRAEGGRLADDRERSESAGQKRFVELEHVTDLPDGHLVFLSWLLNPTTAIPAWPQTVAAPNPVFAELAPWVALFRGTMTARERFYDPKLHRVYVEAGVQGAFLVEHNDNAVLALIGIAR